MPENISPETKTTDLSQVTLFPQKSHNQVKLECRSCENQRLFNYYTLSFPQFWILIDTEC